MGTFETIGFGFDIATAISVIGAAFAFILSTRKENKKNLQNEKVVEIRSQLVEFKEHLDGLLEEIGKKGNVGPLFTKMTEFLRFEMLPVFVIFATQENIDALENMMNETEEAIDAWGDFCEIADKDEMANKTVTEAMHQYSVSMVDLDIQITKNLRNQVHNENKKTSKKIVEWYQKRKYTYREVKFK